MAFNLTSLRMSKEILDLAKNPPHGVTCWAKNDQNNQLEAIIQGSSDTPYENGSFRVDITLPDRYPMEPPQLKFLTKVYNPNIDNSTAVQQLLSDLNPHYPLDAAIAQEFITNHALFVKNARLWTEHYAMDNRLKQLKRKSTDVNCPEGNKRSRPSLPGDVSMNERT